MAHTSSDDRGGAEQGTVLGGRYRLDHSLAEGGMGAVWAGTDLVTREPVAVKLLGDKASRDAEAVQRFHNEVQVANAAQHDGIVKILDIGQDDRGSYYLVMERLVGESLAERLERDRQIEPDLAVDIVVQILDALDAAHARGIVHRDLKPQNIFLCPDSAGTGLCVKILDFGISKMWTGGQPLHLTQTGHVLGTPYFMSPEHARGEKDLDGRTDIWAVGVILYQLVTGELPFEGDNYNEIIARILNEPLRAPRKIEPTLARGLERVILRALTKDRDKRIDSARELREALLAIDETTQEPTGAFRTLIADSLEPVRTGMRSRARWMVLIPIGAVLLMGAITGAILTTHRGGGGRSSTPSTARTVPPAYPVIQPPEPEPVPAPAHSVDGADPQSDGSALPGTDAEQAETVSPTTVALTIRVTPTEARAHAHLVVDGEPVDGFTTAVAPDMPHVIEVAAPGYHVHHERRVLGGDGTIEVALRRVANPSRPSVTPPSPSPPRARKRVDVTIVEEYPQ